MIMVCCVFFLPGRTGAQLPLPATPVYVHYHSANSGLPTDLIYRIHADHNGYLWLATDRGLLRYNGHEFTTVNTGTPEDFIATCVTTGKKLWLFAYSGHTAAVDLNTHRVIHTDSLFGLQQFLPTGSKYLLGNQPDNHTLTLYKGGWVVSVGLATGKSRMKKQSSEESTLQLLKQYRFTTSQQQLLMAELTTIFTHNCFGLFIKDDFITIGNKIFHTVPGRAPTLSFDGTDYGIKTYIMGFARRGDDLYLGGLHDIGLCRIRGYFNRPRAQQVFEQLLPDEPVTNVETDYLGNIWVATHGNGLFLFPYTENNTLYYNKTSGLYSEKVSSVNHYPDGITTVGYDNAMLEVYAGADPRPAQYSLPVKNDIRDVRFVERMAGRWMAFTPNETFYARSQHNALPSAFSQVVPDGRGVDPGYKNGKQYGNRLFYISGNGLVILDTTGHLGQRSFTGKSLPKLLSVLPVSDTEFYLGTVRGCYHNAEALPYLEDVQVNAVDTVVGQLLWATNAGVYTLPLQYAGNGRQLRKITTEPCTHIKHDARYTYLRNGDDLIMMRNSTLMPEVRFSCRDYVIPFRLNRFYTHGNYLVCAGNKGIFYIPETNLMAASGTRIKPKMHVLCSLNGNAPSDSSFTCTYRNGLSVLFTLDMLDYKNEPHQVDCRVYRNDKELYRQSVPDQRGVVSFFPSSPGRYRIEYHIHAEGKVAEQVMAYNLTVTPLWYQQWWCVPVLILFAGSVIIYILYRLYVRKLKDDRLKLQQQLHLQDLESQSLLGQLKPHFIFNILTPLQGFLMTGEKIKGLNYLDSFSRLMRGMLNAIRGRYAPLSAEMEFIKHYLNIQTERFDDCFSYSINIDSSIDPGSCIIPTLMLQPLVENALEHGIVKAGKNGIIKIIVEDLIDAIAIKVEDNGKGLPQDFTMKDNHALTIITERVQLLKKITGIGDFSLRNNNGKPGATALLILSKDKPI